MRRTSRQQITLAAGDMVRVASPIPENKALSGVYPVVQVIAKSAILQLDNERRAVGIDQLQLAPSDRLAQVEADIQDGLTQIEAGRSRLWAAVSAVKAENLWREGGHDSFADYCKARWGWKKSNAYDNAIAGKVYHSLIDSGTAENEVPQSLRVMRELSRVPKESRADVLRQAAATGEPVTAATVREAREAAATRQPDTTSSRPVAPPAPPQSTVKIQGDPIPWVVAYRSPDGLEMRLKRGVA